MVERQTAQDGVFLVGRNSPALHHYTSKVKFVDEFGTTQPALEAHFQDGPLGEHGVNGTTNEEVIRMLIDRLTSLNQPPFNCRENSLAITKLEEALMWLERRTQNRIGRGVEGTNTP